MDFTTLSDAELQELYWSMPCQTEDDWALNDSIAEELSRRKIGIAQALKDVGLADG